MILTRTYAIAARYCAFLFLLSFGQASLAEIVVWEAQGNVRNIDFASGSITEFPSAGIGSPMTLRVTFDTSAPITQTFPSDDGFRYRYEGAVTAYELEIAGNRLARPLQGSRGISIHDNFSFGTGDPVNDGISFFVGVSSASFAQVGLILRSTTNLSIINGPGIPSDPSIFTGLTIQTIQFVDGADFIVGDVTSVQRGEQFALAFPVNGYSSDNAPISAVLDHSGPPNTKDGLVHVFTGEIGDCQYGIQRYKAKDGTRKTFGKKPKSSKEKSLDKACDELKSGAVGKNGYLYAYLEAPGEEGLLYDPYPGDAPYIYYDGHAGYDYSFGNAIVASADGILCVARTSAGDDGSGRWRKSSACPFGRDQINTPAEDAWLKAHTFYIVHPNSDGLSSWYLHSSHLDPIVASQIAANGFATVTKGQVVAQMGGYWNYRAGGVGKHLHFDVRLHGKDLIDPYGWAGNPSLWE